MVYEYTWLTVSCFSVNVLEHDALQVLNLIRPVKNTFVPVNRTPPELLSLIPDYWEDNYSNGDLIKLTHVCCRSRDIFISRPSLWTRLDCKSVEKTRAYIERSKISPLELHLGGRTHIGGEVFLLAVPHINQLKTLSAFSWQPAISARFLPVLVKHFSHPVPLLTKLRINLTLNQVPTLSGTLFNGDPSSLRELHLTGVLMPLSWSGLESVRADLGGHLKYSQRWSGVRAGVLLGAQGAVCRGESRGGL